MQRMGAGKGSRNCWSCAAGCSLQWSWCVVKGIYYSSYRATIHKVIYSLPSRRNISYLTWCCFLQCIVSNVDVQNYSSYISLLSSGSSLLGEYLVTPGSWFWCQGFFEKNNSYERMFFERKLLQQWCMFYLRGQICGGEGRWRTCMNWLTCKTHF